MRFSLRSQRWRTVLVRAAIDAVIVLGSMLLAYLLRFEFLIPTAQVDSLMQALALAVLTKIPLFSVFRVYRFGWRNIGLGELAQTALACVMGTVTLLALTSTLAAVDPASSIGIPWAMIPRSVLAIDMVVCLLAVLSVRVSQRLALQTLSGARRRGTRALVVGAGDAGSELIRALETDDTYAVIGVIDDDPRLLGETVRGALVVGSRDDLAQEIVRREIASVLIAMPSAPPQVIQGTVGKAREAGITDIKIVPPLAELYTGIVTAAALRAVSPEDVLRRAPVHVKEREIASYVSGKTVLVTGAAGSIGSEICRQLLRFGACRLVAIDFNESELFRLESELEHRFAGREMHVIVADVRDARQIERILHQEQPWVVYHAAAYKHVPMMEAFPCEAVKTNVEGTRNVLQAACRTGTDAFVLISTDKAVNPTSVMGATKRIAELMVRSRADGATRCLTVRFGNVLGSRGSVLKTFQDQVTSRQPVTVTHPDMLRFFMITSEAVQLVLQASVIGRSGQVLVLDMGEPVRVVDLAEDVIRFYGLEPYRDVPIVFTEVRPGEKLVEELFTADEAHQTSSHQQLSIASIEPPGGAWLESLTDLTSAAVDGDCTRVLALLHQLVPEYGRKGGSGEAVTGDEGGV